MKKITPNILLTKEANQIIQICKARYLYPETEWFYKKIINDSLIAQLSIPDLLNFLRSDLLPEDDIKQELFILALQYGLFDWKLESGGAILLEELSQYIVSELNLYFNLDSSLSSKKENLNQHLSMRFIFTKDYLPSTNMLSTFEKYLLYLIHEVKLEQPKLSKSLFNNEEVIVTKYQNISQKVLEENNVSKKSDPR